MDPTRQNRDITSLNPRYVSRFLRYADAIRAILPTDQTILWTEFRRTPERQQYLYDLGKSKTLESNHIPGEAADWVPLVTATKELLYDNIIGLYKLVDPRDYGLTSGHHLWLWDATHLQIVEAQGTGRRDI